MSSHNLSSVRIENLAVNAVEDCVLESEYLIPYIKVADKEPLWDGSIYIYNDPSNKNETLTGKVPIQIKGHVSENLLKNEISYSGVKISDLRKYLSISKGVLYFVVYIDGSNYLQHKIYYSDLTPVKLRNLIANNSEKDTTTISLQPFPNNNEQKTNILNRFANECDKDRLIDSLEKARENLRKISVLNDDLTALPISIGEFDAYGQLSRLLKFFSQLRMASHGQLVMFCLTFFLAFRSQISENVAFIVVSVSIIGLYNWRCTRYLTDVIYKLNIQGKFVTWLGFVVSKWIIIPLLITTTIFLSTFFFEIFNFLNYDNIYLVYASLLFMITRVVTQSLYRYANAKRVELHHNMNRDLEGKRQSLKKEIESLKSDSLLNDLPLKYHDSGEIQTLIHNATENDFTRLDVLISYVEYPSKLEETLQQTT